MATADLYAGVCRHGTDPYYFWVSDWKSFQSKWQQLSNQNLRLVDLKVYPSGGTTTFGGVWRAGSDAHYLWVGVDWKYLFTGLVPNHVKFCPDAHAEARASD